jgi:coenzyme Q-binding protein COQ10
MFDLAADVERYPEFLPGYFAARISKHEGNTYHTDQVVGFGAFRERFTSQTVLQAPALIIVTSSDTIFRTCELSWSFTPLPDKGCRVSLLVNLELASTLVQRIVRRSVENSLGSIISAFEDRAHLLFGPSRSSANL